jgi:hypothetical protein
VPRKQRILLRPQANGGGVAAAQPASRHPEIPSPVIGAVLRADVIEMADVRMVQRRNGPGPALHALFQFRRRRKIRSKNFDRHGAIQARIARRKDLVHAACAQRSQNFIGALVLCQK